MQSSKLSSLGKDARTSRLIAAMLAFGFLALLAAAAATFWIQRANEVDSLLVSHTLEVEARLGAFASAAERMETARRGLLLTRNSTFERIVAEAETQARAHLADLDAMVADNPDQQVRIDQLGVLLDRYHDFHRRSMTLAGAERQAMVERFNDDPAVANIRAMRAVVDTMLDEETALLRTRESGRKATQRLFNTALYATGVLILIVAVVTLILIRRNLVELRASREELRRFNLHLEELVDTRTAELKRANAEIQRFAYIVSHDLRSPLVNVMGFTAELETARKNIAAYLDHSDQNGWGAPDATTRLAIEEDLPEAIGFIRSSTQKMDRLINAILRLSREGRRTLAPEPLDLTALAQGIADSLQHHVDEKGASLTVAPLPAVVNDRVAVEQILSNLIENALKYLKPGRPGVITVAGSIDFGRAVIAVTDNGRGIDPHDHERVFDLFRRSGAQDQPGEGIGLAHARALAYRLGGFIELQSALDEGSTFRLILPVEWLGGEEND